jgi:hypothetical protein
VDGNICKQEEERDLASHGANDVECLQLNKLIAVEVEIFFQTGDVCVVWQCLVVSICSAGGTSRGHSLKFDWSMYLTQYARMA